MVVNSLTMEDQSDEDFFDKLVDDEDVGGSGGGWEPSFSSSVGSNDVQVFENLGIEEVGSAVDGLDNVGSVEGFGSNDVVSSEICDGKGDGVGVGVSVAGSQECIDDHGVSGKSGTNGVVSYDLSDGKGYDVGASVVGSLECIDDHGVSGMSGTNGVVSYDLRDGKGVEIGASVVGSQVSMDGKCNDHGTNGVILHGLSNARGDDIGASVTGSQEVVDGKWINHGLNGESEFDSSFNGNGLNVSSGIEEVQGNAFSGGTRKASFSNYFNQIEDDSSDPFSELVGDSMVASAEASLDNVPSNEATTCSTNSYGFGENGGDFHQLSSGESQNGVVVDQNSIEYWESLYPGWRYDPNTGQWLQVDGFVANVSNTEMSNGNVQSTYEGAAVNPTSDIHYLHHTAQSTVSGSMPEGSTTGTSMYWNQAEYENTEYPAHMVFDPNYPGWYYDTIAQEWRSLESYFQSMNQSASMDQSKQSPYQSPSVENYYPEQNNMTDGQGKQINNRSYQLNQQLNWGDSGKEVLSNVTQIDKNTPYENGFASNGPVSYSSDHRTSTPAYQNSFPYEQSNQSFDNGNGFNTPQSFGVDNNAGFQNFAANVNTLQPNHGNSSQPNHYNKEYNQQFSPSNFVSPNALNFSQQPYQNGNLSYSSSEGRSLDGRPPHALVSFGFGGKLVVMKHQSNLHAQPVISGQDSAGGVISILNVIELAMPRNDGSDVGFSGCDYIQTLCQQSFPSPLVSGNVGNKELNKWIDEKIANCDDTQDVDYKKRETLKMVLSLLKIACQFYGKLRSFGANPSSKENDCPESALAKLFSSAKRNTAQFSAVSHCLHNMPSEAQVQAAAEEVQMLLVSGRRMEALQCAQQGHLWGPAIVIASLLGDQFYGETVKQMALAQLVAGSPLRTLCLLIAGQPAEVFSNSLASSAQQGVNVSQSSLVGPGCMLDEWEENLAIISANRTNGDELVITHLGDCLWKERSEVMAAHICYLVAEANMESYSESSRLCLVGADHLKYPRTYASPQAIQRTELYEYAKVLGNSQFVLLPFQPYKLIYACMLAEVGKLTDSLKYCQAVLKSLKTSRSPEVDTLRHMISSLEERIKIHQQGGYGTSFGGGKLVGKLLNFFDNTAHRVVGGLPPPTPSTSHGNGQHSENDHQSRGPRVSTSQSTMAMSSLMTSASAEGSNVKAMHNRSMSEPNFGRTPRKEESPKSSSSSPHDNGSASGNSSRLGRFGSQIFQKTVGLVLRARPDRQAKLGEMNKFYYDENLKRWVEEGAESQVEEMTLAPPPMTATFNNGKLDHDKKIESANSMVHANGGSEFKHPNSNGKGSELPPIPSASNHFSARGRTSVRSRYVDTFNKGGGSPANLFQSPTPSISAVKPPAGNPKFFIPTPAAEGQEPEITQSSQQKIVTDDGSASSNGHNPFSSPQMMTPVPTIQRYPSMDNGMGIMSNSNGPLPPNSNQTLSWGGNLSLPNHSITNMGEIRSPEAAPDF